MSLVAGALPTGGRGRGVGFVLLPVAPVVRTRSVLDSAIDAAAVAGSGRRSVVIVGAARREFHPGEDDDASDPVDDLSSSAREPGDLSNADATRKPGDLSDSSREPGDLSDAAAARKPADLSDAAATRKRADLSDADADADAWEFSDDAAWELPTEDALRSSKRHIAAWVELARLQSTFHVAFDPGILESGRDLRRALEAIGDIDITAPSRPFSLELCLDRIADIIGKKLLNKLRSAETPEDDIQFGWSVLAAQSVIEAVEMLMGVLYSCITSKKDMHPNLPLYTSCPTILKQLLKVLYDCSNIIESTKFRRPQESIRFRMLEAHALSLEHVCAISLDVYQEACQEAPDEKWIMFRKQLMNRRLTLFEQDIGLVDYLKSVGLEDTEKVVEFVEMVVLEVKKNARN